MVDLSPEQLAQRASDLNLVDRRQLESVWSELGTDVSMSAMQRVLLGRGILTNYQFDRLARGEKAGFFYGDYKVLYLVGTGSFARVYRATHRETGQDVALKVLRSRYSESPVQTEQFLREGRMGAELRHPNIVPIFEVFSHKRLHFLVMEFVEGQNLRDFVQVRKKLSIENAVNITTDIAAGLAYAAERGITHRDMKLSNALIASNGRAQIVDFGLAAATAGDEVTADDDLANPRTIDYAGLEKATGCGKDDPRSDIFFLGSMFYQMLCGESPIPFGDRMARMNNSRFSNIKQIQEVDPDIPGVITKVVTKAIKLEVEKRYQTQKELLLDLKMVQQLMRNGKLDKASAELTEDLGPPISVMIVESSQDMQDAFRQRFKKEGWRALVMRNPSLALRRFEGEPDVANVVIFSCIGLGSAGLEAFNAFAKNGATSRVPAIVLLDKVQKGWDEHADLANHRVALTMPVKMKQLREVIGKLTAKKE